MVSLIFFSDWCVLYGTETEFWSRQQKLSMIETTELCWVNSPITVLSSVIKKHNNHPYEILFDKLDFSLKISLLHMHMINSVFLCFIPSVAHALLRL